MVDSKSGTLEQWAEIPGYPAYRVSSLGNVWSDISQRNLKPGTNSSGYPCVVLYDGTVPKKPRSFTVHSLVARAFLGDQPIGTQVNHIDGNKRNNPASNLEYISPRENTHHAIRSGNSGVQYCGSASVNAKLTEGEVKRARELAAVGVRVSSILEQINASRVTRKRISRKCLEFAISGETWAHVR